MASALPALPASRKLLKGAQNCAPRKSAEIAKTARETQQSQILF